MSDQGLGIKEIVRHTGHSRNMIRRVLRGRRSEVFHTRQSSLEIYLPWLDAQWAAGAHNAMELWRQLKGQGFHGCYRVVSEWAVAAAGRRRLTAAL
jgi:transposase